LKEGADGLPPEQQQQVAAPPSETQASRGLSSLIRHEAGR